MNPSYHDLGDHTEAIQLQFDPSQITYGELLNVFWQSHNPTLARPTQYTSIIFTQNEAQAALAHEEWVAENTKRGKLYTALKVAETFYPAEDYHQKYYLQRFSRLTKELRTCYNEFDAFVQSTVAARLNGYLAGYGTLRQLQDEIHCFGLSAEAQQALLAHVV